MRVFMIDGGIGRVVCSTGAFHELAKQEEFIVVTPWPDVFKNVPFKVYYSDQANLFDDVIKNNEYVSIEPYHMSCYYTQKAHLSETLRRIIAPSCPPAPPVIVLDDQEIAWANELKKNALGDTNKTRLVGFQPFGAGAKASQWGIVDPTHRSMSGADASRIADIIEEIAPDVLLVNMSHVPSDHPIVWQQQFSLREFFCTASVLDTAFMVDSSLAHVAAAFDMGCGVHVLGSTYQQNVGYNHYTLFQKEGYPKSYQANRMPSPADRNRDAMVWDDEALMQMAKALVGVK
jgi:hypothetical protein